MGQTHPVAQAPYLRRGKASGLHLPCSLPTPLSRRREHRWEGLCPSTRTHTRTGSLRLPLPDSPRGRPCSARTQPTPHSQTHPGGGPALHAACSPSPGAAPSQGRGGGLFGPPPLASSGVGAQTRHLGPVPSGPWSPRVLHLWGPVSGTTWQTAHKTSPPGGRGDDKRGVGAIPWLSATQLAPLGDVLAK